MKHDELEGEPVGLSASPLISCVYCGAPVRESWMHSCDDCYKLAAKLSTPYEGVLTFKDKNGNVWRCIGTHWRIVKTNSDL